MSNFKKIIISSLVLLFSVTLVNAQSVNNSNNNSNNREEKLEKVKDRLDSLKENKQDTKEEKEQKYEQAKAIWGKVDYDKADLFIGKTGSSSLDAQIKALRDSYLVKLQGLRDQYVKDLGTLLGTSSLKVLPSQASATATASVNKDKSQNNNGLHLGFWKRVKAWFNFNN